MRLARVATVAMLLACGHVGPAAAQSPDFMQYSHTAWRSGSTPDTITTFAQTSDGYVWCGTSRGVYRFDGVRFTNWQPPNGEKLPSEFITGLSVTKDGTLWIATTKGLVAWRSGVLTRYGDGSNIAGNPVEDADGTKWFASFDGKVCAIRGQAVSCEVSTDQPIGVAADPTGTVWLVTFQALWRWRPGPPERYLLPRGDKPVIVLPDAGALLIVGRDNHLWRMTGETIAEVPVSGLGHGPAPAEESPLVIKLLRILRARDGALWMTTEQGLLVVKDERTARFSATDGLSDNSVDAAFEDREGNVWISTRTGLDRFRPRAVRTMSTRDGLSSPTAWAVRATAAGDVWISTAAGLDRIAAGSAGVVRTSLRGLVYALGLDAQGRLLASTPGGLVAERGNTFSRIDGTPQSPDIAIVADPARQIWITTTRGELFGPRSGVPFQRVFLQPPEAAQPPILAVLPDREGGVWLGSTGRTIHVSASRTTTEYVLPKEDLGVVIDLRIGSDGWTWAANGNAGVARMKDGRLMLLTTKAGLPCDSTQWTMEDDDRTLWVGQTCGLVRIDHTEWEAWANDPGRVVKTTLLGSDDGVRRVGFGRTLSPMVTKSPDGRIWFVVADGVAVFDPRRLSATVGSPPLHPQIEQLSADGRTERFLSTLQGRLQLAPSLRNLEIEFTAPAFTAPEKVRFRFRLDGQDPDWREVVSERRVTYSNLPPGPYRFQVMAANASGVWSTDTAVLDFDVAPTFYQRRSFIAAMALLGVLTVGLAYRLRVRQISRTLSRRFDDRLAERTRVAREIHDTFLQTVQGSKLVADHALKNATDHDGVVRAVRQLSDWLTQATDEARSALNSLRASTTATNDLAEMFRRAADECRVTSRAVISVSVQGDAREMHPMVRDEVYRIGYEAIRNACTHSTGNQIAISLEYGHDVTLRISDNGAGIDPVIVETGKAGHFGLRGMRERAERINARFTIVSSPQDGTTITLIVPGRVTHQP